MNKKVILRVISLVMLIVAIVFVCCMMACPTCGSVFYIGSIEIGPEEWWVFYKTYAIVMVGLFLISLLRVKTIRKMSRKSYLIREAPPENGGASFMSPNEYFYIRIG